jgi:iron uptake system component EfeO
MKIRAVVALLAVAALLFVGACGDDDGGEVRDLGGSSSGSGSGSGSGASGSGSGSGISGDGLVTETDNPLVNEAIASYREYVIAQVDQIVEETTLFTDAVRAEDLEEAQAQFAPSRQSWERIEPIAGLVEEIDGAVDARVDDFESEDDPAWTGWHRLEYLVFDQESFEGTAELADQLDADIATLQEQITQIEFPPAVVALGAAELVQEVTEGKITGEEDRYSGTDLWDFAANIEGAQAVIDELAPALEEADPELLADIQAGFAEVQAGLGPYQDGDGYLPYSELADDDKDELQAQLAGLSESLALVPGALGLEQ